MRLSLGCAMMKEADVLLLDEPTNHLDTEAVAWLGDYIKCLKGTCLVISHEPGFLDEVCSDIVHFDDQKLKYYRGNFSSFLVQAAIDGDEAKAVLETKSRPSMVTAGKAIQGSAGEVRISFPVPGKLEGITSTTKPIMEGKSISFAYNEDLPSVFVDLTPKVSLGSRVAVVGANGAGKSTLLALLCGELAPVEGEVVRHRNLRLSYIAQHHTHHLQDFMTCTPTQYFQVRFKNGYDEQVQRHLIDPANEEEAQLRAKLAAKYGKYGCRVRDIVGRHKHHKDVVYEVAWAGLDDSKQNTYEPLSKLKKMRVDGLARAYDERHAAEASGLDQRPLTNREIRLHLENFQMDEEMCTRRMISSFSAGQKCRLMLGAAFWTKPHVIALDEPTNYLDPETVNCLGRALKNFRGGVIVVTHSQHFIDDVCQHVWRLENGSLTVQKLEKVVSAPAALGTRQAAQEEVPVEVKEPVEAEVPRPVSAAATAMAAACTVNTSTPANSSVGKVNQSRKKKR